MTGTLFLVATPIGNLEDISLRALRVLREASVVAAEDTRRTARLFAHYGISTRTLSFHEHNSRARVPQLVAALEEGNRVALVTDAGTPSISDPGLELVQACIERGLPIDPIPGPTAPVTAAMASGFPLNPWTIFGFPPNKSAARLAWFRSIALIEHTVSFFEAPHRISSTLTEAAEVLGSRPLVIGRELTKVHQEFLRGTAQGLAEALASPRGELTVIIGPMPEQMAAERPSDDDIVRAFGHWAKSEGVGRRSAVRQVALELGCPAREIYAAIERAKCSGN